MPALNFKAQFAEKVASGEKCQTIRALRKRPFRAGDDLSFFTGMRTKQCRRLRANARCSRAAAFRLFHWRDRVMVEVDGLYLYSDQAAVLATSDGFDGFCDFVEFFEKTHGLPFTGQLIEWKE